MLRCLYAEYRITMRTTLTIEDELYRKLVARSVERFGSTRSLSALVNEVLKGEPLTKPKTQDAGPRTYSQNLKPRNIARGKTENYILHELEKKGGLLFAVIDPVDYPDLDAAVRTAKAADEGGADIILIGGSTGVQGEMLDTVAHRIKEAVHAPLVLFPGNIGTVTKHADAVYFMSMLNSRNPYWISGAQMLAAPNVRQLGIEPLPTGYIVVEPGGTVGKVGDANCIPRERPKLAAALALAAQYMGFRFIITDAGSNPANGHIPLEMVAAVGKTIDAPYIVAGGIRTPEHARSVIAAGADIIQVGTAFEKEGSAARVRAMVQAVREGARHRK